MDSRKRGRMYNRKMSHNSNKDTSLRDIILIGGLALDITVDNIIGTENGLLCYRY